MKLLANTHVSPETAYVVEGYPYGFRAKCTIRYWLEFNEAKGFRFWSQTFYGGRWNKPKASTYSKFGGAMFLDDEGHVQWDGLSEYSSAAECQRYVDRYIDAVPAAGQSTTRAWAACKRVYEETKSTAASRAEFLRVWAGKEG